MFLHPIFRKIKKISILYSVEGHELQVINYLW